MIEWSTFKNVGNEEKYLKKAIRSQWVSGGEYITKLETAIENIFSCPKAFSVSNGTVAIQLAFQALGAKPGDEIIIPGFCYQAAGNVASQLGLIPIFCDIDDLTFNQTTKDLDSLFTSKTVGIVVVHNYGIAAPIKDISSWAKEKGIWLIEDCAEAWFTKYDNRYVGTFGDMATFSMHATKSIACGEGGMVLVNDHTLINKVSLLRSHGIDRSSKQYLHLLAGNNYRLSNLLCAVALAQLEEKDSIVKNQLKNADLYVKLLEKHCAIQFQKSSKKNDDIPWASAIKINFNKLSISRDCLLVTLKCHGIQTRPGFYSADKLKYHSEKSTEKLNVASKLSKDIIVLPTNDSVTSKEIKIICKSLLSILEENTYIDNNYSFTSALSEPKWKDEINIFLSNLGRGSEQFRYFKNREITAIENHKITLFLKDDSQICAYGHLEEEDNILWLGIAVNKNSLGKGLGKFMLKKLISEAVNYSNEHTKISLRVDHDNDAAINLYKKYGFNPINTLGDSASSLLMERLIEL